MRLSCEIGLPSLSGTPLALVVRESAELSRILNLSDFAKLARYVFACPNPGLSSDSKTQGGSVKAGPGTWPSQWPICWWLAGVQLSKAGG